MNQQCPNCKSELATDHSFCPKCGFDLRSQEKVVPSISSTKTSKGIFRNPFSFEGRIRRTEYGISLIIYLIPVTILNIYVESEPDAGFAFLLYIPLLWFLWAQGAKRCHDRGNSGWFQIIPFYIFWLIFAEGDPLDNEYGQRPK